MKDIREQAEGITEELSQEFQKIIENFVMKYSDSDNTDCPRCIAALMDYGIIPCGADVEDDNPFNMTTIAFKAIDIARENAFQDS